MIVVFALRNVLVSIVKQKLKEQEREMNYEMYVVRWICIYIVRTKRNDKNLIGYSENIIINLTWTQPNNFRFQILIEQWMCQIQQPIFYIHQNIFSIEMIESNIEIEKLKFILFR